MNIYISSSIKETIKDTVELANDLNVNIEVARFVEPNLLEEYPNKELDSYSRVFKNFQGMISLHGPFFDLNPASKDAKIVDITATRYIQALNTAKKLNAKTIVFHSGYNGLVKAEAYYDKFIENQIIFWKEFIKRFEDADITVALENTYEDTPEVISSAIKAVNSKYLKACIDTGHVNINSSLQIIEWIDAFGENLHHMHLHNNNSISDEHNSLLSGTINFSEVFKHLEKNNLNPNLVIEILQEKSALESVDFIKAELDIIYSE